MIRDALARTITPNNPVRNAPQLRHLWYLVPGEPEVTIVSSSRQQGTSGWRENHAIQPERRDLQEVKDPQWDQRRSGTKVRSDPQAGGNQAEGSTRR